MRKWEDIVKDKMEEPEGALPESVLAEFRARRDAAAAAPAPKRFPLVWAIAPAVAAGLVAVLLLRNPAAPDDGIRLVQQPSATVAAVTDTATADEPTQIAPLLAQAVTPKAGRASVVRPQEPIPVENPVENNDSTTEGNDSTTKGVATSPEDESIPPQVNAAREATPKEVATPSTSSPFIPENKGVKPTNLKVAPAAGVIAGGGLLAAVAASLYDGNFMDYPEQMSTAHNCYAGLKPSQGLPDTVLEDERTGNAIHYFPLRLGLSARFPISKRLSITTGLDYSWYRSSFTYLLSGEKVQNAQYLGIPLRLDWTLASNRWLDVYLGGGLEGDWCVGASLAGERVSKDGFGASLQGAGGIQFKPARYVGLYLEPQLNWSFTPENPALETYRTEHPLMFSVAAGLRFTIGK